MARPRKDGTAPKTTKTTKTAKAKAADVEKSVETPDAVTPTIENIEETVEKVDETPTTVAVAELEAEEVVEPDEVVETPVDDETPTEETSAEDTVTETPTAEPEKKEKTSKATKKKKVAINGIVSLSAPTTIYRGPGVYPFAKINGIVKPLENANETGYTKVQCVISGFGACTGYVKL